MARIESIRPGDALTSDFGSYPLPELLMGVLRGNLSGILEVHLSSARKNDIYFRDGVPVAVVLPDVPFSLAHLLADRGMLDREQARRVEARAEARGLSESRVIAADQLVAPGPLGEAIRLRARAQMVSLFDVGDRGFRFVEGAALPGEVEIAVLQPLPLIYAGLLTSSERTYARSFLAAHRHQQFRLTDTFPAGVDPFDWGPQVEQAVTVLAQRAPLDALLERGLGEEEAAVVLASLLLADMIEVLDAPSQGSKPALRTGPRGDAAIAHDDVRVSLERCLESMQARSYFEVLEVASDAPPAEVTRAHRALRAKVERQGGGAGVRGLLALIDEAHDALSDPRLGPRYRVAAAYAAIEAPALSERRRLEAEPKVERALRSMIDGRAGEASYWLAWAARLAPERRDLPVFRAAVPLVGAGAAVRRDLARVLLPAIEDLARPFAPSDRVQLVLAVVLAAAGDEPRARQIFERGWDVGDPLTEWARALLRGD
ncbi:MAG: hypothetical protein IT384_08525 [Deltaproteobacteria bacterium]|nr:hypothetical protein [Deltaproteobacteria bacterium]